MTTVPSRTVGSSELAAGASFDTAFRPASPGPIHVTCTAVGFPMTRPQQLARTVAVLRPGATAPVATVTAKASEPFALDYAITAADLATKGNWLCRVTNPTDSTNNLFEVTITYPSAIPIRTATIDVAFVDNILGAALAAAAPTITIEGSAPDDKIERSYISFSPGFTLVKEHRFRIPDPSLLDHRVFHIPKIVIPVTALGLALTTEPGTPGVPALALEVDAATIVLDGATIVRCAALIGFDGAVTVMVEATSNIHGVDIAAAIQSAVDAKSGTWRGPISDTLRTAFAQLCQLGPGGHVDGVWMRTATVLAVDYHEDPIQPVVNPIQAPPVLR